MAANGARLVAAFAAVAFAFSGAAEDRGHVFVARTAAPYDATTLWGRQQLARDFYVTHGDDYDFLVVFPAIPADLGRDTRGLHYAVRNDVSGIGIPKLNNGNSWGSEARLRGYVDVGSLIPGSGTANVDDALGIVAHEIAHQWTAHVSYFDAGTTQFRTDLLGRDEAHWSFFLESDASVMYGSRWTAGPEGTFVASESRSRYSALDLYLMGFLPPEAVPPVGLLDPAPATTYQPTDLPPADGAVVAATRRTITVDQIIASEGPRVPSSQTSQKTFRAAFVLLLGPGQTPTAEQIAFVDEVRRQWANQFFFLTRGAGVCETNLVGAPGGDVAAHPSFGSGLDFLLSAQRADGSWADLPETTWRDTQAAIEVLAKLRSDPRVAPAIDRAAAYLAAHPPDDADSAARRLLALAAANAAVAPADASVAALAARISAGGVGLRPGYGASVLDTALVGLALASSGAPRPPALIEVLLAAQNPDGGWPYAHGGPSRIEPTSRVAQLLAAEPASFRIGAAADRGIAWLHGRRESTASHWDGTFRDDVRHRPAATALVWEAAAKWNISSLTSGAEQTLLSIQRPDGSWEGSAYQTAEALKVISSGTFPNLAIVAESTFLSAATATEGEWVSATVVVANRGVATASNVVVQAYDGSGQTIGPRATVPSIGANETATVTLALDTRGHIGSDLLYLVVDPDGAIVESNEDDNRLSLPLLVSPPASGADLFVAAGSLSVVPATVERVPSTLQVTATVGNTGLDPVVGAEVALFANEAQVGSVMVDLAAGERRAVTIGGSVASAYVPIPVGVVVNPRGTIPESRSDNNRVQGVVPVKGTVQLAVTAVVPVPAAVDPRGDLLVRYVVRNTGTTDALGAQPVVTILASDGSEVARITPQPHTFRAASETTLEATWRATRIGALRARVQVSHPGDVDHSDDAGEVAFVVNPSGPPNLAVGVGSFSVSPDPPLERRPATLQVEVRNLGASAPGPFTVAFYEGDPGAGGRELGRTVVPDVAPGAAAIARIPWTPDRVASIFLVAVVDPANQIDELDEADNVVVKTVKPLSIPNLVLTDADVIPGDPFPKPGDTVAVTVSVLNGGDQRSAPASVELFLGDVGGKLVGTRPLPEVLGRSRSDVVFSWPTAGLSGSQRLVAVVNRGGTAEESRSDDNTGARAFFLQSGPVAITNRYFSPNGDGIQDEALVNYRVAAPGDLRVRVRSAKAGLVRTLSTTATDRIGTVSWNGRDERNRLVDDGEYTLEVVAVSSVAERAVGSVTAVLDLNRQPFESVQSDAEVLYDFPEDDGRGVPAPDDSGWFHLDSTAGALLFAPRGGGTPVQISSAPLPILDTGIFDDMGAFDVSPDRSRLAFLYQSGAGWGTGSNGYLNVIDLATGQSRRVTGDEHGALGPWQVQFSEDGERVYFTVAWNRYWCSSSWSCSYVWNSLGVQSVGLASGERRAELWTDRGHFAATWAAFALSKGDHALGYFAAGGTGDGFGDAGEVTVVRRETGATPITVNVAPSIGHRPFQWLGDGHRVFIQHPRATSPGIWDVDAPQDPQLAVSARGTEMAASPIGDALVYAESNGDAQHPRTGIWLAKPAGSAAKKILDLDATISNVTWSRGGSYVRASYYDPIAPKSATVELTNALNLGAAIRGSRPFGATSLSFVGTANDLNFAGYEIAVRRSGDKSPPTVIARADLPVTRGVLARWTPPSPGIFEAYLTVRDLAGNSTTKKSKVAWSDQALIANLQADPGYISPNGDGVQDTTRISYTATQPLTTRFTVVSQAGEVRHLDRTHVEPEDSGFTWDGLDAAENVVTDAVYAVGAEGTSTPVVVDTIPPEVSISLLKHDPGATPTWAHQDGVVKCGWNAIKTVYKEIGTRATDRNLRDAVLEIARPGETRFEPFVPANGRVVLPLAAVSGYRFRVSATDRAGNFASTRVPDEPEYLLAVGVGDQATFDAGVGQCEVLGLTYPRLDLMETLPWDVEGPFPDPFDVEGPPPNVYTPKRLYGAIPFVPRRYAFALAHTIRERIQRYSVEYPTGNGGVTVVDTERVTMVGQNQISWDATDLPFDLAGLALTIVATDVTGRRFTTHVPFARGASASMCARLPEPPDRSIDAAQEQAVVTIRSNFLTENDFVATGTLRFTPVGRKAPAVVWPVQGGGGAPLPTEPYVVVHTYGVPRAALPDCRYDVTFDAVTADGHRLYAQTTANLCTPQLVPISETERELVIREGGDLLFRLGHTYRPELGALSGMDVYLGWNPSPLKDPQRMEWSLAGTFTPAPERTILARVPWTKCANPDAVKIVSRFAGGMHGDVILSGGGATRLSGDTVHIAAPCRGYAGGGTCAWADVRLTNRAPAAPRCGSSAPDWGAEIVGSISNGEPIFTAMQAWVGGITNPAAVIATTGFAPGKSFAASGDVNTAAIAEGAYRATVRAQLSDGTHVDAPSAKRIFVDRTPPLQGIQSPAPNAQLCPVQRMVLDGTYESFFAIQGHFSDDWLTAARVRVSAADGRTFDPVEVKLVEHDVNLWADPPRYESWNGTLLEIAARKMPPGAYALDLETRDASGGSFCLPRRVFSVFDAIELTNASVSPTLFAPDGDGVLDVASLSFDVNAPAVLAVTVEDDGAAPLPVLRGTAADGLNSVEWDGRDLTGARVADGFHELRIEVTDGCANKARRNVQVEIDTTRPTVEVQTPAAGAVVGAVVTVTGRVDDAHLLDADVALAQGATTADDAFVTQERFETRRDGVLAAFATGDLAPGDYMIRVRARDQVGHETTRFIPVRIAQQNLLTSLAVSPALFSPNGDGRREIAVVTFRLAGAADASVDLMSQGGAKVLTLVPALPYAAGIHQVTVDAAAVQGLLDGDYQVQVTASAATYVEQAVVPLAIDRAPPTVTVTSPAPGAWVRGGADVRATIRDPHAAGWRIEAGPAGGARTLIASGSGEVAGPLAVLQGLADGDLLLTFTATDEAENEHVETVTFSSDMTPPDVAFLTPLAGEWLGGSPGPAIVSVRAVEAHPRLAELVARTAGGDRALVSTSAPAGQALTASWDVSVEVEGPVTLVARVEDLAGNVTTRQIEVGIDRTAPIARIASPRDGYLSDALVFTGTASDANLARYTLEIAAGPPGTAVDFVPIGGGATSVDGGTLGQLAARPADGTYTARLVVTDRAGHRSEDLVAFVVDSTPPGPPAQLAVAPQRPRDAVLTWGASTSTDVVGYVVERAGASGDPAPVTGTITGTRYVDPGLADGTYRWAVVAVDASGRWSDRSNEVTLTIDTRPPSVAIARPAPGARVGGVVELTGMATSGDGDFAWYRLSVGAGTAPTSFREFKRATAPVPYGTLGELDTQGLAEGATHVVLLEAEDVAGNHAEARTQILVDNAPPAAPVLVSADPAGLDVDLAWSAIAEADLAGFLVYRNGLLVGVPATANLWDLRPYALGAATRTYRDGQVPDGTFRYQVQAIDAAGNLSAMSNAITVAFDRHAPRAVIVTPADLARLQADADVGAECADEDVAQVRIEARTGEGAFVPLATATRAPFLARIERAAFGSPVVEVRAVATDRAGNTDPSPRSTFLLFADPPAPPIPRPHVDGLTVSLAWDDVGAAGYEVDGGNTWMSPVPITGTASASSTESGSAPSVLNRSGAWRPAGPAPQWWRADLSTPALIDHVSTSASPDATVDIRLKVAGAWVPIARGVSASTFLRVEPPLAAEAVEIDFVEMPASTVQLQSVSLGGPPLADPQPLTITNYGVGDYGYTITAISPFGLRTPATAQAHLYRTTLATASEIVPSARATVTGGARPGVQVALAVDPAAAATIAVLAAADGTYSAEVPLSRGPNRVVAVGVDAEGNRSVPSDPLTITFAPPPEVAVALHLQGIAGSEVDLAFDVTGDTSDVVAYRLVRQPAEGNAVTASLDASARTYRDVAVPNGQYVYTVTAVNGAGFVGAPSNPVSAAVAVTPLPAPTELVVTAPPTGAELLLSWTANAPAGTVYEIARGLASASLTPIATASTTGYDDLAVFDGSTYWYEVRAVDPVGNRSAPSNLASGTPRRIRQMPPPRITAPTDARAPVTLAVATTAIGGIAEGGSRVEVFRGGVSVGTTTAGPDALVATEFALQGHPNEWMDVDGSAARVAYTGWGTTAQELVWEELATGTRLAIPLTSAYVRGLWLAPDGQRFVVALQSSSDGSVRLHVGRPGVLGAALADVSEAAYELGVSWSPDSTRFAYATREGGVPIVRLVDTAAGTVFAAIAGARAPAWAGAGKVAYVSPSTSEYTIPATIVLFDVASATTTELRQVLGAGALAASPGGTWLAYRDLSYRAYAIRLAGGEPVLLSTYLPTLTTVAFSPDERQVAFDEEGVLKLRGLPAGEQMVPGLRVSSLRWTSRGLVGWAQYGSPSFLEAGGQFHLANVALDEGSNRFSATAQDASGNRSAPSAEIRVVYDPHLRPDLAIAAEVRPATPIAGSTANAVLTVRNLGRSPSSSVRVAAAVASPDGAARALAPTSLCPLDPGNSATIVVALDTRGLSGPQTLVAVVDAERAGADADRSNDRAEASFVVVAAGELTVMTSVSPALVGANTATTATAVVTNSATARDVAVRVTLQDAAGAVVAQVHPDATFSPLGASAVVDVTRTFDSGSLAPGRYQAVAEVVEAGAVIGRGAAPLTIAPDVSVGLTVAATRATYVSGEAIALDARVENRSANALLTDATCRLEVLDAGGAVVFTTAAPLPNLARGAVATPAASVPALARGAYLARATVLHGATAVQSATAPFTVLGQAALAGSIAVDAVGDPPSVPETRPLAARITIRNSGGVPATAVTATLRVVDPVTWAVLYQETLPVGTLGAGASWTSDRSVPTAGFGLGIRSMALAAAFDGGSEGALASVRVRIRDGLAPALAVEGPLDGAVVAGAVDAVVHAVDLGSGTAAVRVETGGHATFLTLWSGTTLDGAWTGTVPLGPDGLHVLTVTGTDLEGNDGLVFPNERDPVHVTVVSDTIDPEVSISGVVDGALVGTAVAPVVAASDVNLAGVKATLDGAVFASGTLVDEDGHHVVEARAWDRAGHSAQARVAFTVDRTPPVVAWRGIADGECVNRAVTPIVDVWDAHPLGYEATLGGAPFVPGTALLDDGRYELAVTARDLAGNVASSQVRFTIDRSPPAIVLAGFVDGSIEVGPVVPTYAVTDSNLLAVEATLDGVPFQSGAAVVASDGLHLVHVVALDAAGNRSERSAAFTVDGAPPVIAVSGVVDGEVTARDVVPVVTVSDANLAGIDVRLDGAPLPPGSAVSLEGPHVLAVDARDLAGNTARVEVRFTVDRSPPAIALDGVLDGQDYPRAVIPTYTATDANLAELHGVLDGAAFSSGTPVVTEGTHTLTVSAVDLAGNRRDRSATFTVDLTPPVVEIIGVDRRYSDAVSLTPSFVATDARLSEVTALLDATPFVSGAAVTAEGPHHLQVTARDRAGNSTTRFADFTLDRTVPEVALTGVAPFAIVRGPVILEASAQDANLEGVTATLDGSAYASGTTITAPGAHLARAEAKDLAGNRAVASLEFTIDRTAPVIVVAGVTEGEVTARDVVPVVTVTDDHIASWTVTVDGATLPTGGAVTGEGDHVIVVTAQDLAGNDARAQLQFTIDRTPPVVTASVLDGVTYDPPVAVTFAATDAHLATVSATLDGAAVTSAVVSAAGAHTLVVAATDHAGNATARTLTFTVRPAGSADGSNHVQRLPRILVYAGDGCRSRTPEGSRLRRLIETAAPPGAPLAQAWSTGELLAGLRSGLHDVFVVGVLQARGRCDHDGARAAVASACAGDHACDHGDPEEDGHEDDDREHDDGEHRDHHACDRWAPQLEAELTEAVFRGAGLVVVKDAASEDPDLREALGVHFEERLPGGPVRVTETALAHAVTLHVAGAVELDLEHASAVGRRGDEVVLAVNAFGRGSAVTASFDLGAATPHSATSAALRGILEFVTPEPTAAPLGVLAVGLDVHGTAAGQRLRATERVPAPLRIAEVLDAGVVHGTDVEWIGTTTADGHAAFRYLVRLPAAAGSYGTTTDLDGADAAGWRRLGTYPLTLDLADGARELEEDARTLASTLPDRGQPGKVRRLVLERLSAVSRNPGLTADERERAIAALLDAVEHVRTLDEPARTPLRYALDRLLGYWEAMP